MKREIITIFLMLFGFMMQAFVLEIEPLCIVYTPDSILAHKEDFRPWYVGGKLRYGTCTGVAWFHQDYLAVANLYGNKIITYRFDKETATCNELQTLGADCFAPLKYLEQLVISPDGKILAVAGSARDIQFYELDSTNHLIHQHCILRLHTTDLAHNVKFSPDGTFFVCATFDSRNALQIFRVVRESGNFRLEFTDKKTHSLPMKLKAISFTKDSKYIVLAYAYSVGAANKPVQNKLAVHLFNQIDGTLGAEISTAMGNFSTEDIVLVDNDHIILATDQASDSLVAYQFDPVNGRIGECSILGLAEMQLNFPHGISASPDGNYLAVTNYGDDKFNIYRLNQCE